MVPISTGSRWRQPRKLVPAGNGTVLVPLTKGFVATIDETDAAEIEKWNWNADVCPSRLAVYARRCARIDGRSICIMLHRFLWSCWGNDAAEQIDHIDGDGLNNRRSNLRAATPQQNAANRGACSRSKSGLKGVTFVARVGKWVARICINGRDRYLGAFETAEEAAAAYRRSATELFGEFARTA